LIKALFDLEGKNHGKYFLTLVFVSVFSLLFFSLNNNAFADTMPPSECPNNYNDIITSATIFALGKTYDPTTNPNVIFQLATDQSYNVTFTMHTSSQSSQGNSNPGTVWYVSTGVGAYGVCVNTSGPNQDVTVSLHETFDGGPTPQTQKNIEFDIFSPQGFVKGFSYTVNWIGPPQQPTNLVATAISSSQINLSWSTPSNNGGSAITGYEIERSTDGGTTWSNIQSNTGSTATTYSDTGLTASTTYTYRVSAINSVGTSGPSNTAATTFAILTVNSQDMLGNQITGLWIELHSANGDTIASGYTPINFDVVQGTQYTVYAANYLNYVFLHWDDGSMNHYRNIMPNANVTLTATYTP
jgi:Fibronectin type III domain